MNARVAVLLVLLLFCFASSGQIGDGTEDEDWGRVKISVVYDNYSFDERLRTAWGFSCLVQGLEETILFDTGGDSATLLGNMSALGINPSSIDTVVLSHIHGDHVGGLGGLLDKTEVARVVVPASFPEQFKLDVRSYGAEVVEVRGPSRICDGADSTGELGRGIREQSLIVRTNAGPVLITGCAHPGIALIAETATQIAGRSIELAVGGFHMLGMSKTQIDRVIALLADMGVGRVGPCHCSGDMARKLFREAYKTDYVEIGVGRILEWEG